MVCQNEGLPNITGQFRSWTGLNAGNWHEVNLTPLGAFSVGETILPLSAYGTTFNSTGDEKHSKRYVNFNASLSNSTYGRSDEVRTKNTSIRIWKRTN